MKKKSLKFVLTICFVLPFTFIMSACNDDVTDCAYVQFVSAIDGEVVQYTSYMYADDGTKAHIYLYESEEKKNNKNDFGVIDYLLKISFKRGLGVDYEVDEKDTLVVDIEDWYNMEIRIKKEYYDSTKKIYLNGIDITSLANSAISTPPKEGTNSFGTFWYDAVYYFEDFKLVKGNTSNYINKIEYK